MLGGYVTYSDVIVVLFARHRLSVALSLLLLTIFFQIIVLNPFADLFKRSTELGTPWGFSAASTMSVFLPLILFSVAPAKAITRRLIFLALGLLLLIALNELSKLGLDLTAPKLQG